MTSKLKLSFVGAVMGIMSSIPMAQAQLFTKDEVKCDTDFIFQGYICGKKTYEPLAQFSTCSVVKRQGTVRDLRTGNMFTIPLEALRIDTDFLTASDIKDTLDPEINTPNPTSVYQNFKEQLDLGWKALKAVTEAQICSPKS